MSANAATGKEAATRKTPMLRRRLSRAFGVALFVFGVAIAIFPDATADYARAIAAPDGIYVPRPRHEFSEREIGAARRVLTHTFRIYNLRPRRLTLKAEADCGCTGTSWQRATLAPFSWVDLTATLEAKPQKTGRSVGIVLRTDSAATPFVFVFLVA